MKRSGLSWGPIAVLVISTFGMAIFKTHAWPGGPVTFGRIAIAGAWSLWERTRRARVGIETAQQAHAADAPSSRG